LRPASVYSMWWWWWWWWRRRRWWWWRFIVFLLPRNDDCRTRGNSQKL